MRHEFAPIFPDIELDVLSSVRIPKVYAVKLSHPHTEALPDVEHRVRLELDKSKRFGSLHKGASVAVAVGSRGIADIGKVVSACIRWLVEKGYSPVIIPAMGSHGGATGEGQRQILQGLGITEASVEPRFKVPWM
jgi:hypothetical protein